MKEVKVLGVDLSKSVFQLHGVDEHGHVVLREKVSRSKLRGVIAQLPSCLIGMEACAGAYYWARAFQQFGHVVKLMAPQFVRPYVKTNKNDANDAEAICEAVNRPQMRFVALKSVEQQDLQSIHRIRERLVKARTALANEVRGLLQEFGIVLPQGLASLKRRLPEILADEENGLSGGFREILMELSGELRALDARLKLYEQRIERFLSQSPLSRRLLQIPGVGILTATAMVAAVGDGSHFKNGRQLSAYLGLVPRQYSSGGKHRLLGISKRGDRYLRTLLVHGGRAVVREVQGKKDRRSLWIQELIERRGKNRAAVAVANKNARTIWALMHSGKNYCASEVNH